MNFIYRSLGADLQPILSIFFMEANLLINLANVPANEHTYVLRTSNLF